MTANNTRFQFSYSGNKYGYKNASGTFVPFENSSDATATADKILSGYTAYAKGQKLTGTASAGGFDVVYWAHPWDSYIYVNKINGTTKTVYGVNYYNMTSDDYSYIGGNFLKYIKKSSGSERIYFYDIGKNAIKSSFSIWANKTSSKDVGPQNLMDADYNIAVFYETILS